MGQEAYIDRKTTTIDAGKVIFKKGQQAQFAAILLKGSVRVRMPYGGYRLMAGDVLGLFDVYAGTYLFDYIASEQVQFYPLYIHDSEEVADALANDKKYISFSLISGAGQIKNLFRSYDVLFICVKGTYQRMKIAYEKYKNYAKKFMIPMPPLKEIEELTPEYEKYQMKRSIVQRASELPKLSYESVTAMLGDAPALAELFLSDESEMAIQADNACRELLEFLKTEMRLLSDRGEQNLFAGFHIMASKIQEAKGDETIVIKELDALLNEINALSTTIENDLGIWIDQENERLSDMRNSLSVKDTAPTEGKVLYHYSANDVEFAMASVRNATNRIMDYADLTTAEREEFIGALTAYRLKQKQNFNDDDSREAIRNLELVYYLLYEKVFFRSESDDEIPAVVRLFLDYGVLSEKDFSEEEIVKLFHTAQSIRCDSSHIHTMREWLHLIYKGEKEPSRNELDEDYRDSLIQLKRKCTMTAQEEKEYLSDGVRKVQYEIQNMIRMNNRMIFASNATFCPFVYGEEFSKDILKQVMDTAALSEALTKIRDVDYSLFYRETLYRAGDRKTEHLRIMQEVLPDLILIPNIGARGSMWQEIEGRKRVSPARFMLPMYPTADLQEILLPMVAKYRWEFCRTEQGSRWNNISEKSLTAEYYDYIQYYKKNGELSDTAKAKIKEKMSQHRNSICEVFVQDYISWIRYESQGASRLNKVAREILAQYCPFSQSVRTTLLSNPMFGDLMSRKENQLAKKTREISQHYQSLQKEGVEITEELQNHLEFFQK